MAFIDPFASGSFGAPGTTATDRAEGIFSDADISLKDPKTGKPTTSWAKDPVQSVNGFVDPFETKAFIDPFEKPKEAKAPEGFERYGKEALQIADMVAGLPAFLFKMGQTAMGDVIFATKGSQSPMKDSREAVETINDNSVMKFLEQPLQSIAKMVGVKDTASGTSVAAFGKGLEDVTEHAAEYWTEKTGNPEAGEAIRQGMNIVMAGLGDVAIKGGKAIFKGKPKVEGKVEEAIPVKEEFKPQEELKNQDDLPFSSSLEEAGVRQSKANDQFDLFDEQHTPKVKEELAPKEEPIATENLNVEKPVEDTLTIPVEETSIPELGDTTPLGGTGKRGFGQGGASNFGFAEAIVDRFSKGREKKQPKFNINEPVKNWDAENKINNRAIMQGENLLTKLEPKKEIREQLYHDIDAGKNLTNPFVKAYRTLSDEIFKTAQEHGVVDSYVENYITHMYDFGKQASTNTGKVLNQLIERTQRQVGAGMASKSPYARQRTFDTIKEAADEMGLKPLTTDPKEVFNVYANSMLKAVANKKLIAELKDIKNPDTGEAMIIARPKDKMPKDYVSIDHPQFFGQMVHKDVAPIMESMFSNYKAGTIMQTVHAASILAKTAIFSLSGFHIKSLGDALLGSTRGKDAIFGQRALMKQWKEGGAGDVVDSLLKGGLEIGHSSIDINPSVFSAIVKDTGNLLDRVAPGLGQGVRIPAKGVTALNDFLWKVVHPSFKLAVASQEYGRLVAKGMESSKAAELASTFANDAFGGLNWRRLALDADTSLGAKIANEAASKRGQAYQQSGLLAPDWTVATARSWLGAIRKGKSPHERKMYQKYLLQSALGYSVMADILNLHFSGHHFWENDDPTRVDLGDGRTMQLSKHFMEGVHWLQHPGQTALNKLGTVPKELMEQFQNKEYLSAKGAPNIWDPVNDSIPTILGKSLKHSGKKFIPITGQTLMNQSTESALSGFLGAPIYGKATGDISAQQDALEERINKMLEKYKD